MKMKKNKFFAMLLSLACVAGLAACDDDADISGKTALKAPEVSQTYGDYQSLYFEWKPVDNMTQYGYKLYDPDGTVVDAGVTKDPRAGIDGLQPETVYTLRVWAFAGLDTDFESSPAAELTAATDPLIRLSAPTGLTVTGSDGDYTVSWTAVDNAEMYVYDLYTVENVKVKSGTVYAPEVSFTISGLGHGQDYYVTLQATATVPGYLDSETVRTEFSYVPGPGDISWQVSGSYYSYMYDDTWDATMICYVDGLYTIKSFYGVDGYNLDFTLDRNNVPTLLTGQLYEDGDYRYWLIPTGISYMDQMYYIYAYIWDNYTYFDGDSTGGELGIGNYGYDPYGWGFDTFTW